MRRHLLVSDSTSVRPMKAATPRRAAVIAAPSFGMIPPSSVPPASSSSAVATSIESTTSPSRMKPVDVGEEEQPVGAEADGERGRGLVGVDVQRPDRERRDDRDPARLERCATSARRLGGIGSPTRPSSGTGVASSPISSPKNGTARVADRRAERRVDARRATRGRSRCPAASSRAGRRRTRPGCPRAPSRRGSAGRRRGRRTPRARPRARGRASAESPATAPPTLTTSRLTCGSPR